MTFPSQATSLRIGKQSAYATAATTDRDCGLVLQSANLSIGAEVQESQGIGGLATTHVSDGTVIPSLSLEGEFQHGRLLEYVFGTVAHAQHLATSDWTHTYTIGNASYMTAELGFSLAGEAAETMVDGLTVTSATIRSALNERVTLSVDFEGRAATTGTTPGAITTSTLPVFPHEDVTITINSQAAPEVQDFEIQISKSVQNSGGIGSLSPLQTHPTELKIAFNATLGFDDKEYQDLFVNRTSHAITFVADNGTALGSGKRSLNISLQECLLTEMSTPVSVGGLTFVSISGVGRINAATSVDNLTSSTW